MSDIVTPCCGAELVIITRDDGRGYMSSDVPDEILCGAEKCYNTWDPKGRSDDHH